MYLILRCVMKKSVLLQGCNYIFVYKHLVQKMHIVEISHHLTKGLTFFSFYSWEFFIY